MLSQDFLFIKCTGVWRNLYRDLLEGSEVYCYDAMFGKMLIDNKIQDSLKGGSHQVSHDHENFVEAMKEINFETQKAVLQKLQKNSASFVLEMHRNSVKLEQICSHLPSLLRSESCRFHIYSFIKYLVM